MDSSHSFQRWIGSRFTRRLCTCYLVWHFLRHSNLVQRLPGGKAIAQPAGPIQLIPVLERRFTHMNMDIVGPLPTSAEWYSYLFAMVDKSISAQKCVNTFISTWVARYWVPDIITSDQGHQLISVLWT